MIEDYITVYDATDSHSMPIAVYIFESVAEKYEVKDGQRIYDKEKFRNMFIDNCHHGIAICKLNIALKDEFDTV